MANILERNGAYRITVYVGEDKNGKQLVERTTYRPEATTPKAKEREVKEFAQQFERRVKEGKYLEGDKLTFGEFEEIWRREWAVENLTQSALEGYNDTLKVRVDPYLANLKLSKITALHIKSMYTKLKEERNLQPTTIRRTHTVVNSVFSYAYQMGTIKENVCDRVKLSKITQDDELHYFTLEQAKTFLDALTKEYEFYYSGSNRMISETGKEYHVANYTEKHSIPLQYQVYFTLAIYGGFRRGEMIGLTWNNVDFDNRTISITKAVAKTKEYGQIVKEPKTKSGKRCIKLPNKCFELLKVWKNEEQKLCLSLGSQWKGYRGQNYDKNYVFIQLDNGLMMNLDTPSHKFKEIIDMYNKTCENDYDKLPVIKLHDLRHTSATMLISEGVDIATVSHRLGHSKISTTTDIYTHWLEKKDETASNKLEELFG